MSARSRAHPWWGPRFRPASDEVWVAAQADLVCAIWESLEAWWISDDKLKKAYSWIFSEGK